MYLIIVLIHKIIKKNNTWQQKQKLSFRTPSLKKDTDMLKHVQRSIMEWSVDCSTSHERVRGCSSRRREANFKYKFKFKGRKLSCEMSPLFYECIYKNAFKLNLKYLKCRILRKWKIFWICWMNFTHKVENQRRLFW